MTGFDLVCGGREWRVFEGVTPEVGWYARVWLSSPPVVLRAPDLGAVLVKLTHWRGRLWRLLTSPAMREV